MRVIRFKQRLMGIGKPDQIIVLGEAVKVEGKGWAFFPDPQWGGAIGGAGATWEACLPKWVQYPNGCESEVVE